MQLVVFEESQLICKRGEKGVAFYMVVSGQCCVEHGAFAHEDCAMFHVFVTFP